jgi:hypothetical protein
MQLARAEAEMRGLAISDLQLGEGTVIVEKANRLALLPPGRSVAVHELDDLDGIFELLEPQRDRIQGTALAGRRAEVLRPALEALGVRRFAPPGHLQRTDALWANGETHLVERLA